MSPSESQGFPKTGRRGTSAALRAEGWSAARTELVSSCPLSKSLASKRHGRGPLHGKWPVPRCPLAGQLSMSRRCSGLAVMSPQPVDVVRYGVLDVVLRPEAGVRPQSGGVEVVV